MSQRNALIIMNVITNNAIHRVTIETKFAKNYELKQFYAYLMIHIIYLHTFYATFLFLMLLQKKMYNWAKLQKMT